VSSVAQVATVPSREAFAVLVPMELVRILISEINDQQVIFLRETEGDRQFPILIGLFEATSIDRRVRGEMPPRPLTHDLLKGVIEMLGGEAQDVVITHLQDHTYFASIRVRKDGELLEIDSRPSDAIALAVHYQPYLPIYVEDTVLEEVAS
jgi:bifunctional DNase/RNase